MSDDRPVKRNPLWQELKRRKVFRVMTMYAATAFIIMEAAEIMLPRLGLPDWTVTFVIVLLIVGFPVVIIISWIFDLTPEGVKKTESIEELKDKKEDPLPELKQPAPKNIFSASNLVITLLLVVVCILLYPKIFKADQLKELRDEGGMISVAVLPFENLTGDTSLYFWENGISEYLINGLATSPELAVSSSQVVSDVLIAERQVNSASVTPEIARKTAQKINASTYITGNFMGPDQDLSIMLNLVNVKSGKVIWSTRADGDLNSNYRGVLDQLSDAVRNYMEIKALEDRMENDYSNAFPNSSVAYRNYIDGLKAIVNSNYDAAIEFLLEAYETDTTFTFAAFYLALAHNLSGQAELSPGSERWTLRAHELKDNLPPAFRPWIEFWYATEHSKDENALRNNLDLMFESALHSRFLWFDLGITYADFLRDYDRSILAFEEIEALNRQWEDDWRYDRYYSQYAESLLMADRPEDADRIANLGLKINPLNQWLHLAKGASLVMLNDTVKTDAYIKYLRTLAKVNGFTESYLQRGLGIMYCWGKDSLTAALHYMKAFEMDPTMVGSLNMYIRCQLTCNVNLHECLQLTDYGLELNPDALNFRWSKAIALYKLGRSKEALPIFRKVEDEYHQYSWELQYYIQEIEEALMESSP